MSNLIEEGRSNLGQREQLAQANRDLFTSIVDVVAKRGELQRSLLTRNQVVRHTFNHSVIPVNIEIWTKGKDPEKTTRAHLWVQGVGEIEVKNKGNQRYEASELKPGRIYRTGLDGRLYLGNDLDRVKDYKATLEQVKEELGISE